MRERLVAAFVGLAVVIVALYGIPRAYLLADLVRSHEQDGARRSAEVVAVAVDDRIAAGGAVDRAFLDRLSGDGESVVVRLDGERVSSSEGDGGADVEVTATEKLDGGGSVTVWRSDDEVGKDVSQALLPLVLLGLGLVAVAALAGVLIARRMSRPFQDLAAAARGLGTGDLHPQLPTYRTPEAQAISEALTSSGERISALLEHERDLVTNASHELRTPVTALRLGLEDLAGWPQTPPDVAAELHRSTAELVRLDAAVDAMLLRAREQLAGGVIDLDLVALVDDVAARLGVPVDHLSSGPLPARLDPHPVVQVLEAVTVTGSRLQTRDHATHLEVRVLGEVAPPASVAWAPAGELAASVGGQLNRDSDGTAVLRLPKKPSADADD